MGISFLYSVIFGIFPVFASNVVSPLAASLLSRKGLHRDLIGISSGWNPINTASDGLWLGFG